MALHDNPGRRSAAMPRRYALGLIVAAPFGATKKQNAWSWLGSAMKLIVAAPFGEAKHEQGYL